MARTSNKRKAQSERMKAYWRKRHATELRKRSTVRPVAQIIEEVAQEDVQKTYKDGAIRAFEAFPALLRELL